MTLEEYVDLSHLNTLGVAAKTRYFASFSDSEQLVRLLALSQAQKWPLLILGGGSNVLFRTDWPGLVLRNEIKGISSRRGEGDHIYVRAGAGENWHQFVTHCLKMGWYGLENLSLIPGNVGASPMQNIGAYGVEIKDRFSQLEAIAVADGSVEHFDKNRCSFGYRESVFKNEFKNSFVITQVEFKLSTTPHLHTTYGAIQQELSSMNVVEPTPTDVSEAVIRIRRSKLPDPAELGNAGSFFKNPVVSSEVAQALANQDPDVPHYPQADGTIKLSAGWLIEKAGWKGLRKGRCGMHAKQALVLVNYGGASGEELYQFSEEVIASVYHIFGITLTREVNIIE